jgi:hypothetical protein
VGCRRGQRARGEARTDYEPSHGVRISNCRCDAPARCGAFADERRNKVAGDRGGPTKADAKLPRARRHRRPPQRWILSGSGSPLTGALIAPFPCEAPARGGAFVDERRVVAGGVGGRVRTSTHIHSLGGAAPPTVRASVLDCPPMRHGSRRSVRLARPEFERLAPFHTGVLIATFRCATPSRSARRR